MAIALCVYMANFSDICLSTSYKSVEFHALESAPAVEQLSEGAGRGLPGLPTVTGPTQHPLPGQAVSCVGVIPFSPLPHGAAPMLKPALFGVKRFDVV